MVYFDSAYIAKFYLKEKGHAQVKALAEKAETVTSSWLAYAEVMAVFHRYLREGVFDRKTATAFIVQFDHDVKHELWSLVPVTQSVLLGVGEIYKQLGSGVWLRSADAIHLVTAKEHGFKSIHSNDRQLLKAAPELGLKPVDVVPVK